MGQNSTTQRESPKGKQIIVDVNYKLALASSSTRIKSCAVAVVDFQHPLKGVQVGEQKKGTTVFWEKLA